MFRLYEPSVYEANGIIPESMGLFACLKVRGRSNWK